MSGLAVRPLEIGDLDGLLALYAHLHIDDEPLPSRAQVDAVAQQVLAQPGQCVFGGFADRELVCSCVLVTVPNLTRGCRPYGLIENVVTHAAHRGRGHGTTLLSAALQRAWAQGCYKVMLMTGRCDEAVFRFYEAAGFDRHGKQAFIARPPGEPGAP